MTRLLGLGVLHYPRKEPKICINNELLYPQEAEKWLVENYGDDKLASLVNVTSKADNHDVFVISKIF